MHVAGYVVGLIFGVCLSFSWLDGPQHVWGGIVATVSGWRACVSKA